MTGRDTRRCPGRCGLLIPARRVACPDCLNRLPADIRLVLKHTTPVADWQTPERLARSMADSRAAQDARDWLLENPSAPNPDADISALCECGARILWLTTDAGKRMPVDADPDPERGNIVRSGRHAGVLGDQGARSARAAGTPLWLHHRASCAKAGQWSDAGPRRKARR